eukprot:SAG22_NODE_83_length_21704_cov_58.556584_5_plen_145_part_00
MNHTGGIDPDAHGQWRSGVGLARTRLDGFLSLDTPLLKDGEQGWDGSELLTKPLVFKGKGLQLNVDTGAAGSVLVEMQDAASGVPLPGFSLNDSVPLVSNSVRALVSWQAAGGGETTDVGSLAGKTVRVRLVTLGTKLYSIQFV